MANFGFNDEQIKRYSRQIILPEIGSEGQKKLQKAKVLCVGAGGLGSPAAFYLAAAGIGTIGIVDKDKVDISNLQRQILHSYNDIGKLKTESAKETLESLNSDVNVVAYAKELTSKNIKGIIKNFDIVVDGCDNFATKYLINDACVLLNKPDVYGSATGFDGHASVFNYKNGPCYRCLFPKPPKPGSIPSCAEAGVLGALPGVIGTIQATEVLKIILGKGNVLSGRFLVYNALDMAFKELKLSKNKQCPICGKIQV